MKCHSTIVPSSHRQKDFDTQHASQGPDGALCSLCHGKNPCLSCHQGLPMPHDEDFKTQQHGSIALSNPSACAACHKDQKVCMTCHEKIGSLHPENFVLEHKTTAKFGKDATCFLCHKLDYCQMCHPDAKLQ